MVMEDVDPGPLAPGRVRVSVTACGICGSDLHVYAGRSTRHNNVVMGHEIVGTIIDGGACLPTLYTPSSPWTPAWIATTARPAPPTSAPT